MKILIYLTSRICLGFRGNPHPRPSAPSPALQRVSLSASCPVRPLLIRNFEKLTDTSFHLYFLPSSRYVSFAPKRETTKITVFYQRNYPKRNSVARKGLLNASNAYKFSFILEIQWHHKQASSKRKIRTCLVTML
jgi:hypothetical protein